MQTHRVCTCDSWCLCVMIKLILCWWWLCTLAPTCTADQRGIVKPLPKAEPKQFPHMVALGYLVDTQREWACGGSLVSAEFVLTAAHCLNHVYKGRVRFARVGDLNLSTEKDDARPETIEVAIAIPHPDYRPSHNHVDYPDRGWYNDIGLIKLGRCAILSQYAQPICLPSSVAVSLDNFNENIKSTPNQSRTAMTLLATGWGKDEFSDRAVGPLLRKTATQIDLAQCKAVAQYSNGLNDTVDMCAVFEPRNLCQMEEGGPLQIYNPEAKQCRSTVIAVASVGAACAIGNNKPFTFARVQPHVRWIESVVFASTIS